MNWLEALGRKFARLTTNAVVRSPRLWRLFRVLMRAQFDQLAPRWDQMRSSNPLGSFDRALEAVHGTPKRALDLGTGTGIGAFLIARRYPEAEVVGVDLSERMLDEARCKTPPELASRIRFQEADASSLPFPDESFDLVGLANMIPFFDELARIVAPGGSVVFSFSAGADTPIYVPSERLRDELSRRGFTQFADFRVEAGTSFLARKEEQG